MDDKSKDSDGSDSEYECSTTSSESNDWCFSKRIIDFGSESNYESCDDDSDNGGHHAADDENSDRNDENHQNNSPNFCRGRTKSVTDERSKSLNIILVQEGYKAYLKCLYGKGVNSKSIYQIIQHVAVYLSWIERFLLQNNDNSLAWCAAQKLCFVFETNPKSIVMFLLYLESRQCKALTCHSYTNSIANCLNWLSLDFRSEYQFDRVPVETVIKMCRRKYKKEGRVRHFQLSDTNTMVGERLWPASGIPDLQKPVNDRMAWAESLVINLFIFNLLYAYNINIFLGSRNIGKEDFYISSKL